MKVEARFTHDKLDHSKQNEIHVVVSLTAPKKDWEKERQPICIIPVIDVSGSMQGEKLDYAKQSVIKLIDHLRGMKGEDLWVHPTDQHPNERVHAIAARVLVEQLALEDSAK